MPIFATAVARPSNELRDADLGSRFRIVHVDGSHRYDIVRQDIAAAVDLVTDGGVIVIDDYRTLPHALGVAVVLIFDGCVCHHIAWSGRSYAGKA